VLGWNWDELVDESERGVAEAAANPAVKFERKACAASTTNDLMVRNIALMLNGCLDG
jgi:hypothetical protein